MTEVAAPITGPDGPVAYLWLGYRTEQVQEEVRPETLRDKPMATDLAAAPAPG